MSVSFQTEHPSTVFCSKTCLWLVPLSARSLHITWWLASLHWVAAWFPGQLVARLLNRPHRGVPYIKLMVCLWYWKTFRRCKHVTQTQTCHLHVHSVSSLLWEITHRLPMSQFVSHSLESWFDWLPCLLKKKPKNTSPLYSSVQRLQCNSKALVACKTNWNYNTEQHLFKSNLKQICPRYTDHMKSGQPTGPGQASEATMGTGEVTRQGLRWACAAVAPDSPPWRMEMKYNVVCLKVLCLFIELIR